MKISIITAVYNGEKYIRQMCDSIHSQQGDFELEHIVCDGLSTDKTLEILKEYPNIKVVSRKDSGPFEAINNGMNMATGDIGAWLNADDLYAPGALQKVISFFDKNPECQWLYGNCPIVDAENKEIRKLITLYKELLGYFYSYNVLLCENFINQPATFWRMELWRKIGGLHSIYKAAWDYELWLKMSQESPARHIHQDLAYFRRHETSISETSFIRQFNEELTIARNYGNAIHHLLHKFNQWKITTVYKMLSRHTEQK